MLPKPLFVLFLTLPFPKVGFCHEEAGMESAAQGFGNSLKETFLKGIQMVREGLGRAEDVITSVREKIVPFSSNFSSGVKEQIEEGIEKVRTILIQSKNSVAPYVEKVRTGLLNSIQRVREKLSQKPDMNITVIDKST